ncbi:MAG: hypothetical protein JSS07_07145 [Proteobacteria bacterium]|nr:hypothetical protein [Pseudomonadota bacterium]
MIARLLRSFINLLIFNLYSDCDLVYARHLPRDFSILPGGSNFVYLFTQNNLYFLDKNNNTYMLIPMRPNGLTALKASLKWNVAANADNFLVEEKAYASKVREIVRQTRVAPPINYSSILNTFFTFALMGFIPKAWTFGFPIFIFYGLYKKRALAQFLYRTCNFTGLRKLYNNFSQTLGEKLGEAVSNHPISLLKGIWLFSMLLIMDLNAWSVIAIYGVYRFSNVQWLNTLQKWSDSLYNFANGLYSKTLTHVGFYPRIGICFGLGAFLAWHVMPLGSFGFILLPLSILQFAFIAIGLSALFNDLSYALKHPLKLLLNSSGRILGSLWGRWISHRIFSGTLSGNLGPAMGHVVTPGLFSGFFSSFLTPSTSFTVGSDFTNILVARVKNLFNNLLTSIFFTSEMQIQGNFHGTVGPTSLQIFMFMLAGYIAGYLVERIVNKMMNNVVNDVAQLPQVAVSASRNLTPVTPEPRVKWQIAYFGLATSILMCSPAGASLVVFAGGSLLKGTLLGAGGMVLTWQALETVRFSFNYLRELSRRPPAPAQRSLPRPNHMPRQVGMPGNAPAITPGFNIQRNIAGQQPQVGPAPAPREVPLRPSA